MATLVYSDELMITKVGCWEGNLVAAVLLSLMCTIPHYLVLGSFVCIGY